MLNHAFFHKRMEAGTGHRTNGEHGTFNQNKKALLPYLPLLNPEKLTVSKYVPLPPLPPLLQDAWSQTASLFIGVQPANDLIFFHQHFKFFAAARSSQPPIGGDNILEYITKVLRKEGQLEEFLDRMHQWAPILDQDW